MNPDCVQYCLQGSVATITMDDGKSNLISPIMLTQLNRALDQAEKDNAIVILTGRDGIFCAGFDLNILKTGIGNAFGMLIGGFELSARLLAFPTPVLVASNGHAIAMGAFLLLSADYRIGVAGDYKIAANEVAIGLAVPFSAIEVCRQRLKPAHFNRVVLLSEYYNPESAVDAGFLDRLVAKEELLSEANALALEYAKLNLQAHKLTKLRMRKGLLRKVNQGIWRDRVSLLGLGLKRMMFSKK